jgi:hypothetical protein
LPTTTNFLEVLVDDEEVEFNHICGGNRHIFSGLTKEQEKGIVKEEQRGANMGFEVVMKSKILFHFIKGKIFLTPMETILIILRKLEYLEGLIKLARRTKNVERQRSQIAMIHSTPSIKRVSVNKTHRNKTLHLAGEINQAIIEILVDTKASMSVMVASVVKKFGIMHLVVGHETYKIAFGIVTQTLGRIIELSIKVERIICQMIFFMVNTNNYDLLLGLDFLIKIGVIVDVEKGIIQVHNGPRIKVEVLPLNVVNMLQVLERSKEEKCNILEELFNREMGQL